MLLCIISHNIFSCFFISILNYLLKLIICIIIWSATLLKSSVRKAVRLTRCWYYSSGMSVWLHLYKILSRICNADSALLFVCLLFPAVYFCPKGS
jgi:hypothetical protein